MQTIQRVFEPFQDKQSNLTSANMAAASPCGYIEAMV
jgi:hypothetical protein